MDSAKKVWWIIPFKKIYMISVNQNLSVNKLMDIVNLIIDLDSQGQQICFNL